MKNFKNISLLTMIFITSLQASNPQIVDSNEIEWVRESTPKYAYSIKEKIKKAHGKTVEPSIDIKYVKNKLNSGINRIKTVVEPVGNEIKIVTETWTDLNPSYLTWDNAMLAAAVIGIIGAGAYAYNEFNNLNEDLMNYENHRQIKGGEQTLLDIQTTKTILPLLRIFSTSNENIEIMSQKLKEGDELVKHQMNAVTKNKNFNAERFKEFNEKLAEKDRLAKENYRAEREKSSSVN